MSDARREEAAARRKANTEAAWEAALKGHQPRSAVSTVALLVIAGLILRSVGK